MDIGICVASRVTDTDYVVRAEALGYSRAWFADVQMLWSDPYAAAALAAERTSTIKIGTGVSVAATRPSVVTAASMATINQLAPGRTFCGIGTGNTAVRIMGLKPMTIAEFDRYLVELGPLLRGQEALVTWRGTTSPVRHIMADQGFVNFNDPMPLYVSGFGPRSMALAGKHGDGIVLSIPLQERMMERVWRAVESGAAEVDRTIDRSAFYAATLTTIVVLEPGETPDSDRVKDQCGAFAIASLHYAYDQWRNYGREPSNPAVAEVWEEYRSLLDQVPEPIRHQRVHQGHNCWVVPEEQQFVTLELMQASCLIGEPDEIVDRLMALDAAGLDHVMILPPFDVRFDVLEVVGQHIIPRLS